MYGLGATVNGKQEQTGRHTSANDLTGRAQHHTAHHTRRRSSSPPASDSSRTSLQEKTADCSHQVQHARNIQKTAAQFSKPLAKVHHAVAYSKGRSKTKCKVAASRMQESKNWLSLPLFIAQTCRTLYTLSGQTCSADTHVISGDRQAMKSSPAGHQLQTCDTPNSPTAVQSSRGRWRRLSRSQTSSF